RHLVTRQHREVVVEADRLVHGDQRVETVRPLSTHAEQEVDLRRGPHRQSVADWAHASASAIRANCSIVSDSPRASGAMPTRRNAASAASPEPASPRRAPRNPLRRWANAASTTANTASRDAVVSGGSRRVQATSPESTFGAGQKTLRPMAPAR